MKKLLNTLYVTTPDSYLSKDGTNIVVSSKNIELFRIPIQNIESICTFGYQGASPGAMKLCVDNKVGLSFFTPNSQFIARIQGKINGNVLLRHRQYGWCGNQAETLYLSKLVISSKIYNSRNVLRRFVRDYPEHKACNVVSDAAAKLRSRMIMSNNAESVEELRGLEGDAAAIYFGVFSNLILNPDSIFEFNKRNRRPPLDAVNAMLSFGYSLLTAQCASALEGVGLDPAVGFMHSLRPGRNSLALDMMEEFRAYLVDRFVISLINNRQIGMSDFKFHNSTTDETALPVLLTDDGRKKFLSAWQLRKKKEIIHPFLEERIPIGLIPHVQAMLLARYLRNDIDSYPVFLSK